MKYLYKIEVECFQYDGKYQWTLWRRPKDDPYADFDTCAIGLAGGEWDAFQHALKTKNRFEKEDKQL